MLECARLACPAAAAAALCAIVLLPVPASAQAAIPGTVQAEDFDDGGPWVSYFDTTPGNSGGAYRDSDVDIETSGAGGYDVGWIDAGEWLNYTVSVTTAGTYTLQFHVASPGGGALHVGFNGPSAGTWQAVSIPATGDWQAWSVVTAQLSLQPGIQQMTLYFDTGGFNVDSVDAELGAVSTAAPVSRGGSLSVVTWNINSVEPWNAGWDHAVAVIDHLVWLSPMPDVIVLQEALSSQFGTYLAELRAQTGFAWTGVFAAHCSPGAWNGGWCSAPQDEGVAVVTHLPVVDTATALLPFADDWHSGRALARASIDVGGGRVVNFFAAHMSNSPGARYQMMQALIGIAAGSWGPVMVAGDFNADPDQIDQWWAMGSAFSDAWQTVGSGPGYTATTPWPSMHLDYWFDNYSGFVHPRWAYVDVSAWTMSDHFPVHAEYAVY
jgi:endonuclease/exonuclease/phosphatase family metal-dependent hydrolase